MIFIVSWLQITRVLDTLWWSSSNESFNILQDCILLFAKAFLPYKVFEGVVESIQKGQILVNILLFGIMKRVEIDNVEEFLEKVVTKDGKVGGLTKHAGKTVMVVVTKKEK